MAAASSSLKFDLTTNYNDYKNLVALNTDIVLWIAQAWYRHGSSQPAVAATAIRASKCTASSDPSSGRVQRPMSLLIAERSLLPWPRRVQRQPHRP